MYSIYLCTVRKCLRIGKSASRDLGGAVVCPIYDVLVYSIYNTVTSQHTDERILYIWHLSHGTDLSHTADPHPNILTWQNVSIGCTPASADNKVYS
jgi:hypothetical protein